MKLSNLADQASIGSFTAITLPRARPDRRGQVELARVNKITCQSRRKSSDQRDQSLAAKMSFEEQQSNKPRKRIVIIGGGIIGAATAYYLARRDVGVTVIERLGIACAASGRAGGFLALDWQEGSPTGPLSRRSFALHAQLAKDLSADIGYRSVSTLSVSASATKHNKAKTKSAVQCPSWLDGNVYKSQSMGDSSSTAQVHPEHLTKALLAEAERTTDTSVVIGTVTGLVIGNSETDNEKHVHGVRIGDRIVPADAVVIAMGPWSSQAAQWLPIPKITGQKATSVVFRPNDAVTDDMIFLEYTDANGKQSAPEMYPRPDGTVYVCGEGDSDPLPDDPSLISASASHIKKLQAVAASVSSCLAAAPIEAKQACFLPCSSDGHPLVGAVPGVMGAYIASGDSLAPPL